MFTANLRDSNMNLTKISIKYAILNKLKTK